MPRRKPFKGSCYDSKMQALLNDTLGKELEICCWEIEKNIKAAGVLAA